MSSKDWRVCTIGTLIDEGAIVAHKDGNHGSNYPRVEEFVDEGVPFLSAKLLEEGRINFDAAPRLTNARANRFTFGFIQSYDVLLSHNATVGRVALVPEISEQVLIGTSLTMFRLNPTKILPGYFLAYLCGRDFQNQLAAVMSQSTRNQVPITSQRSLTIVVPPLVQQQSIAEILGSLANKIELNRQTNQTLEQIAQALFKSWFVDFEPTRAKIAAKEAGASPEEIERAAMCAISGKTPDQLPQLPPETQQNLKTTAALFPDALMDSELGEIPAGWKVKQLSELGNIVCGKTPPKDNPEYYDGEIPFIKIPDMHGKVYATKTSDTLTLAGANTQIKKLLPKDSVCVSCIATVGLVSLTCVDSFTNQQINTIVPNNKNHSQYIYFAMLGLNEHLHDLASGGSATLNLNTGHFSKIKIILPGEGILENFANQVRPIFDLRIH